MNKKSFSLLTIFLVTLFTLSVSADQRQPAREGAQRVRGEQEEIIPGEYIVVLKENGLLKKIFGAPEPKIKEIARAYALSPVLVYSSVFKGFSAKISKEVVEELKKDPRVLMVSQNRKVRAFAFQPVQVIPNGVKRLKADQASLKGKGVEVAIIDTGISINHPDLKDRILGGKNCLSSASFEDDNGHGTHVAGTVAASNNDLGVVGVAPEAKLWGVKVLSSTGGSWQSVICGIDFVTSMAPVNGGNVKVANMSLGGLGSSDNNCGRDNSDALHNAICNSKEAGVTYVVAAGNDAFKAEEFVPAAYDDAVITVSALSDSDGLPGSLGLVTKNGSDDSFATFSNFGSVVDLAAPGTNILSTWLGDGYKSIDGTSMASPHVAGAAALYIESHPKADWKEVRDALKATGEKVGEGHKNTFNRNLEPVVQINF